LYAVLFFFTYVLQNYCVFDAAAVNIPCVALVNQYHLVKVNQTNPNIF